AKDISHRKQLSMSSYLNHKAFLETKQLSLKVRMRLFNAYITSIFMYNSELWTITKKLENVINVFQRNLLRKILKIKYPDTIRNSVLYKKTKEVPWSKKIRIRRLRWCGHLLRLPDKAPAKIALNEIIKVDKVNKRSNRK